MTIAIIVAASIAAWVGFAFANKALYVRMYKSCGPGLDTDFIVMLGPIGTFMLACCAGLQGYINLTTYLGKRFYNAPALGLVAATLLVPWLGGSVASYVLYKRVLEAEPGDMGCDFIVALGPIGTFMLGCCALIRVGENVWHAVAGSRA